MLPRRPAVLMYHGFTPERPRADDPHHLFVPVPDLVAQLAMLRHQGWRPLDVDGYLASRRSMRRSFLLTVDDGLVSVADLALPVLRDAGVPIVLFVPSHLMGRTAAWLPEPAGEPLLDAAELRALVGEGVEIGVHGADHTALLGLDDEALHHQVVASREALADLIGVRPRTFAYPFGAFDDRSLAAVERAGYDVAFSVFTDAGRHAVSRVDVNATDTARSLRVKLLPGYRVAHRTLDHAPWLRAGLRERLTSEQPLPAPVESQPPEDLTGRVAS
jgi:peptidoglycan/xylan/chitin deacetylase (PgdA/CDA1 family)